MPSAGKYALEAKIEGQWRTLAANQQSHADSLAKHAIQIRAQGSHIPIYIDSMNVFDGDNAALAHGHVGLLVAANRGDVGRISITQFELRSP